MEENMVSRQEVQDIMDRSEREIHRDLKSIRDGFEKEMHDIARYEVQQARESIMKFIGWGGMLSIGGAFWFFSGMQADVRYLQEDVRAFNDSISAVEDFMNRGDRFTVSDGNDLKAYVDQQDEYIIRRVDDGFASLSEQIGRLEN